MSQKPSRLRTEHLITLDPLTEAQENVFTSWKDGFNLVLSGSQVQVKPLFQPIYH